LGKDAQGFGKASIHARCSESAQDSTAWQEMTKEGYHRHV